jgi:hypothetical protein
MPFAGIESMAREKMLIKKFNLNLFDRRIVMCRKLVLLISFILASATCGVVQANLEGWEAAISDANPLHWYKFDETGADCIDSGSGGLNGTYSGVTLGQDGIFNAAAAVGFVRSENDAVNFTGATDLPGPWTVEYIVKASLAAAAQTGQALNDGDSTSIRLNGWTNLGEAGFTQYGVADYRFTPAAGSTLEDLIVPQDVWMHIVWRNDGSGTQLFFNGELMGTSTDTVDLPRLRIGTHGSGDSFEGVLDEAVFFDRALTDAEILAHATPTFPVKATKPYPEDGAIHADTWVSLGWTAGSTAASHDLYIGENFDQVNEGTGDTFRGNQDLILNFAIVGFVGYPYPDGLVPGTTYYWRIDEVEADGETKHKGDIWSFLVPPKTAYNPVPADGAEYIGVDVSLSWTPGYEAALHTVYFGDDFDDVNNAIGRPPLTTTTYDPGPLEKDKSYYWRVDEFDGSVTHKGEVWSLTTRPEILITDPNLVGWWSLDEGSGSVAVDWSGHDNYGSLIGEPQWVVGQDGGALEFDGSNSVDCGNSDNLQITDSITITCWVNPAMLSGWHGLAGLNGSYSFKHLDNHLVFTTPGILDHLGYNAILEVGVWQHVAVTFQPNQVGGAVFYINGVQADRVDSSDFNTGSGPFLIGNNQWNEHYTGLIDDVRIYNKILTAAEITEAMRGDPLVAWGPSPANGSTPDVDSALPLTFSPGDNASQHDVYFGTDQDAVADADTTTAEIYRGRQSGTSYTPPEGVEWGGGPYYWRIDEYNTDGSISKGKIWKFTVGDFILVDDFESYNAGENQIWFFWYDGLGFGAPGSASYYPGNGTGAAVGDETSPSYMEESIVNSGSKSMPVAYDNNKQGYSKYSEVELTLAAPRDWTKNDLAELSLWFRGYPASTGSFVEGPVGTYTMTGSGADIWGTSDQFHFAFKNLTGAGSIVAKVESVENTNGWAKAGVMIRETLDADSAHAMMVVTPLQGVSFQRRNVTGGSSADDTTGGINAPYWVKIERDLSGNFTASSSANGSNWQMLGTPDNITMGANAYIGLVVVSTNANLTCQAVLSNVSTTGNVTGQWTNQDIGINSNVAEPLYVAISNVAGASAIVTHEDPAAAQIDTWTEWVIPLQALADQGVNLADVDRIAIGLGTRGNTTIPGGAGKMFFDDIRLYRSREAAE